MKLPQSWFDVSIAKFLEYNTILTSKIVDPLDLEVNILACFSGLPVKEIETLKTREIMAHIKSLSFLKDLPKTKIPYLFKINGDVYRSSLTMDDMTAGQLMNFSDILKGVKPEDYVYQMADLIGAMCVKRTTGLFLTNGKFHFVRYKYDGYKANAEAFNKHMSIAQAYPFYVFFCKVMEKLLPDTQSYLTSEIKKLEKKSKSRKRAKWGFLSIGGGTRSRTASATTTSPNGNT